MAIDENPAEFRRMAKQDIELSTATELLSWAVWLGWIRVTSLEQLSLPEFSDEYTRQKVYENDHKKVLGIWLDLVLKVKF